MGSLNSKANQNDSGQVTFLRVAPAPSANDETIKNRNDNRRKRRQKYVDVKISDGNEKEESANNNQVATNVRPLTTGAIGREEGSSSPSPTLSPTSAWSGPMAPTTISPNHVRGIKLRILVFEIGEATLERVLRKRVIEKGFEGWRPWLQKYHMDVYRFQYFMQVSSNVYPEPYPSSWDITFLTYLSRLSCMDLPSKKKAAADKLRVCRNQLSHEIGPCVEEQQFQLFWDRVKNCILDMSDKNDAQRLKKELKILRSLRIGDSVAGNENRGADSGPCRCDGVRCENDRENTSGANLNNQNANQFSYPCWICGGERRFRYFH